MKKPPSRGNGIPQKHRNRKETEQNEKMTDDASANIFNTFSFKKWSDKLREKQMEDEIQKQRMDQVARLREKLSHERTLREQADMLNDDDINRLVEFLNEGGSLTGPPISITTVPSNGAPAGAFPSALPSNPFARFGNMPKSDADIINEVKKYSKKKRLSSIPKYIFNYNRKYAEPTAPQPSQSMPSDLQLYEFEYNRRYGNLV